MQTDENGWEAGARLESVIQRLSEWHRELDSDKPFDPIERAERISLLNQIDTAIQLLKLCDEFGVTAGAFWDRIPDLIHPSYTPEIRIVNDQETDDPTYWRELALASGHAVRMRGGEVVIGGSRTSPDSRPSAEQRITEQGGAH